MHNRCFIQHVSNTKKEHECNEFFGGPLVCVHCLGNTSAARNGGASLRRALIDREETLKYFRTGYNGKYKIPYNASLADSDLTLEEKRSMLGIALTWRGKDTTDYSVFGPTGGSSEAVTRELLAHRRTIDAIFENRTYKFNAQHLYRLGVRTKQDVCALGYNPLTHLGVAYRSHCPLWMMVEVYGVDADDLFKEFTADALLRTNLTCKEFWLAGVTMQLLIDHKLTKEAFLRYANTQSAHDMFAYLELEPAHFTRLGVTGSDISAAWKTEAARDAAVQTLLENVMEE